MGKRWTDKEDETLLLILSTSPKASYKEVARSMNRTPCSIRARYIKLRKQRGDLPPRGGVYTPEERVKVAALAKKHTLNEIAEIMNRSIHAIRCYCFRNNITLKVRR
nr:MAG TPA: Pre-mRNA-splicing factor spp42, Pre-mRNA-splicing factor, U2/U5/U6, Lariat, RNA BINDING [Caudoviricetes sp.]